MRQKVISQRKKEEVDPKINHIQITKKEKAKDISCL